MKIRKSDTTRIPLTEEMIRTMKGHQERTGVGANKLLSGKRKDLPEGLNSALIRNYFQGNSKTIRKDHYEYVIREWETLPDNSYVEVTDEIKKHFQSIQDQIADILECPKMRLKAHRAANGIHKTVPKRIVNILMAIEPPKYTRRPISDEERQKLQYYRSQFGLLPGKIFLVSNDVPEGLTPYTVSNWLDQDVKSAMGHYIDWVLKQCHDMVKEYSSNG